MGDGLICLRRAVVALTGGSGTFLIATNGEVQVMGHIKVQVAILIVIDEGGAGAPTGVGDSGFFGDIGEGPVAVIPVQCVRSKVGDVEIGVAIVVIVADGNSHTIPGGGQTCLFGDVHKPQF